MKQSIQNSWNKVLSLLLVFALLVPMIPAPVYGAEPTPQEKYNSYVAEMTAAATSISAIAATYGEVDFGNGYKVNLQTELTAFADNIQTDLGVAAAIVGRNCNDSRLKASGVNNSSSTGYNQSNFNTAFPDEYAAAVKYLEQGGIAVQKYGGFLNAQLQYFFSYKSMLNPGYSASNSALGMNESGKTNIVTLSKNYPETIGTAALSLTAMLDMLKNYKSEADLDKLQAYFLTLPCTDANCENSGSVECTDWTHRLLVPKDEFLAAVDKFRDDIDHDIKIAGDLATGKIDSGLWFANKSGQSYYSNTAAVRIIDKLNAAIGFLNNGGYTCGSVSLVTTWNSQLSYRSSFNPGYHVSTSVSSFTESNQSAVLPLVDGTLNILRCGATADNLGMVYDLKVNEINGYIAQAEELRGTTVPEGGTYNQSQYDAAIEDFVAKAEGDLYIASFLLSGELDKNLASTWTETLGFLLPKSLIDTYKDMSVAERQANAIRLLNEGGYAYGYSILGFGYQLEYKSNFYPGYSSGLFGMGANKANVVTVMHDTLEALKQGNKYMTAAELAKYQYEQSLARMQAIKNDPSGIVSQLLNNDAQLKSLIGDLNIIVGSLDDIVSIIETSQKLGIGKDILDPILNQAGLSYDMLVQLADLRDTLKNLGIDTSGNVPIEDSLEPIANSLVGSVIDLAIFSAQTSASFGTESGYKTATSILDNSYDTLMTSASNAISALLEPVVKIVEPIRPYLKILGSGIELIQNVFTIVDQVNALQSNFTAGGLSQTTYTMARTLDSLADLLTGIQDSKINELLLALLANGDLGGSIANGTADLLNRLVNQMIGMDIGLSGTDLGFLSSAANSLAEQGLKNPTALVPLLRASADALRRVAELEGGIQDAINGDYESAIKALTKDLGGLIRKTVTLWNTLVALFEEPAVQQLGELSIDQATGELDLDGLDGDVFLASFAKGMNEEAEETFRVVLDPQCSSGEKIAKIREFRNFIKDVRAFVSALEDACENLKSLCKWAEDNLTREEAKAFIETLARHYVLELRACVKQGINSNAVQSVIGEIKDTAAEIKDLLKFIKCTGDLEIIATPGENDVFYTLTTNYDPLRTRLDSLLRSLGITTGFKVNSPADLFMVDGNQLIACGELEEGSYQVKVAYQMYFAVCSREFASTLATKWITIEIGEEVPDPVLTGIAITKAPLRLSYVVGESLDLTGLEVTAYHDIGPEQVLDPDDCDIDPCGGTVLDSEGIVRVKVTYEGFSDTFTVSVAADSGEKSKFTVRFDTKGGSLSSGAADSVTAEEGKEILLPGASRANHSFGGWFDEEEAYVGKDGDIYTVSRDVVLFAGWTFNGEPSRPSGGGGSSRTQILDEPVPLGGLYTLMALAAEPKDGIVYYQNEAGETVFVPFCFVIGDKIYFFGQAGIEYRVKANPKQFSDIDGHWAQNNILAIASREAFQGYPDGSFQPGQSMTRAMLASVFARMAAADTSAYTARVFDDVSPDAWYGPSVAWALEKGIVTGVGSNKFSPNANVTRQDMALMLTRFIAYMNIQLKEVQNVPFADQDAAGSWAKDAIKEVQKYSIVGGKPNNLFDPHSNSTRAEIATMLYRLIETSITFAQENNADKMKQTN